MMIGELSVGRVGRRLMLWGLLVASALLMASIARADEQPALVSDWQYYGFDSNSNPLCANSDSDAANQTVAAVFAGTCSPSFHAWTGAWPNSVGITDYYHACPPTGIPYVWGFSHRETRPFSVDYALHTGGGGCGTPTQTSSSVGRQFWYYCADSTNYTLVAPVVTGIPFCRRNAGTVSSVKQPKCSVGCTAGNPINLFTGLKYQRERDYVSAGPSPLVWERFYASAAGWRTSYSRFLFVYRVTSGSGSHTLPYYILEVHRDDGQILSFDNNQGNGSIWEGDGDVVLRVATLFNPDGSVVSHTLADENDTVETYDAVGLLTSAKARGGATQFFVHDTAGHLLGVTDSFGRAMTFTNNSAGRIDSMTDPNGGVYAYQYDSAGNITSVTFPDLSVRTYVHNEPANTSGANLPYSLTGVIDENLARYATYQYDAAGRGISTQHAGGAGLTAITYNTDGSAVVTDALGAVRTHTFKTVWYVGHVAAVTGSPCIGCGLDTSYAYDSSGNVSSAVDFKGIRTGYSYSADGRNLQTSRTEASGTLRARTITTTWSPGFRVPATITEPNRTTAFTYDGNGNVLTKTITDTSVTPNVSRTWTSTYDSYSRVLTTDGPRTDVSDVTTYAYYTCATGYQCGQLQTVTDAAGHVTTFNTYNAHGQPLTITDPNGVVTTLTYDARQRLTSRQVGGETTGFSYWPTGLLKQVTLPDASYLLYSYDAAHRLTQISDGLGNAVDYTLDAMGNRTAENVYDPSNVLHQEHTRVINSLNELYQDVNAAGTAAGTTTFGYDANGNQTSIGAPLSRNTANAYDELNRLKQITDPASGVTQLGYDANDNLTSVIDPRSLTTAYTYDGFGDLKTQVSPDSGTTTNTYDSGGNLATATDARGAVSTYSYDALNRVTSVAYSLGGTTDQTLAFTYDAGTNGKGHLTSTSDANHSLSWTYDGLGRVTSKGQTIGSVTHSVGYAYTNGDLTSLTTPSGQTVTYGYNANHQVTSVAVNGTTVLNGVSYEPLGPVNGWTWGNGAATTRTYDTDGKITQISSAGLKTYSYDNAFRISGISDTSAGAANWTYGYDLLDRMTSGVSSSATRGWSYDANGNRTAETGSAASTYTVSSASNRISSITGALARTYSYDAAGNTLTYSTVTATYNDRGRTATVTTGGVTETLLYNALGQMIKTTGGAAGTVLYWYDEAGHLLGEYSSTGALIEETVWLGDIPVATLRPSGATVAVYYVHTDQLNTPRAVTRPSDNVQMWTWFADPFGITAANSNPAGAGTFTYNLRSPGQIFDGQAGLHQNYFRDYDPATGRYVESDPIGLTGGSYSTYAYVGSNPVGKTDPLGLQEAEPIEQLPAAVRESNRWNEPWRQLGREFPGPPKSQVPKPYCFTECPVQDACKAPVSSRGVPAPGLPGCYAQCTTGPFMSPIPPPTPTPPPRQMTRGDWFNLFSLIRAIASSW